MVAGGATGVGDGGTGVVCTAADGSKSFDLLDLYEAEQLHGVSFNLFTMSESYVVEISNLQSMYETTTGDLSLRNVFFFAQTTKPLLRDGLGFSYDVLPFTLALREGCELRQIGYRYSSYARSVVEIDRETWQGLSTRQQALLMIHEALHDRLASGFQGASDLREVVAFIAAPIDFQIKNANRIRQILQSNAVQALLGH